MKLVLIHGIAQSRNSGDRLRDDWVDDLIQAGVDPALLAAANPEMAYYACELAEGRGAIKAQEPLVAGLPRAEFVYRVTADMISAAAAMAAGAVNQADIAKLARNLKIGDRTASGINPFEIADEIFDYLTKPTLRRQIDDKVASYLTGQPLVIVAHSLGTLVAFRLLRDRKIQCRRLVTLGSPLSIAIVRQAIGGSFSYPANLQDWRNFYDPADIVCLGRPFKPGHPNWSPRLQQVQVDNKELFGHDADGYLRTREVAAAVQQALAG
jgi:pimeloyl-ACP methyl ester carboxylesterase